MTSVRTHGTWVYVETPSAEAALMLERRLAHLGATAVGRGDVWTVEVEDAGRLDEIVASVRHWLRELRLGATKVVVGTTPHIVAMGPVDPFAEDDAEFVLAHEP